MRSDMALRSSMLVVAVALAGLFVGLDAQQGTTTVAIDADDIGGVVTRSNGPEAGVWVVAETTDFPTRLIKIVTTDDGGRYVLPDLPPANFQVFVRGYGLVDSTLVEARPVSSPCGTSKGPRAPTASSSSCSCVHIHSPSRRFFETT